MSDRIGVIVNFCSNDGHLIGPSLDQLNQFASRVLVTYTDHFYNGQPENLELVKKIIRQNPGVEFVKIKYHLVEPPIPERICQLIPRSTNLRPLYGPHYWACFARYIGYRKINKKDLDYLMFLDADEVIDGKRFRLYLDKKDYRRYQALHFSCYFYFRDPQHRATVNEGCGLFIKNTTLNKKTFLSHFDRENVFRKMPGPKRKFVLGPDQRPMIHHYAWARGLENMLQKVSTWGHSRERDWVSLVRNEFSHPFNGTDFLRGYRYRRVKPFIDF